jgi:dephospho-CoA kinase
MMVKGGADQVPPFIALTGGIGAGKSTALAALERLGSAVLSSDEVVHELYGSERIRDAVVARFGSKVAPTGVVDRGQLATVAFATPESRAWLEQLIWPLVRDAVSAWRTASEQADPRPRALVVEVPLLFEGGQERVYDATIAVTADEDVRRARASARGHRAVGEREARQLSQADKAARATYVVTNDGDIDELQRELSSVLAMLGV